MGFAALALAEQHPPPDRGRARAYVVDDDSAVRAAVSLLVRTGGWDAVPCRGVEDFLSRYRPAGTQCVIADLRMPGRGGLDLQRELHRRGDRVPVIVVTAQRGQPDADAALGLGARAVLGKPFNDGELLRLLEGFLEEG